MSKEKNKKNAKTKSSQKNIAEKPANETPGAEQPAGNQPQAKKGKGCLACGIVAVVVVVLLIIGFVALNFLRFWFPPTFLLGLFSHLSGIENVGQFSSSGLGKNQPVPNMANAVKKLIKAKDGGTIEATTESGLTTTLNIPPDSLSEDTEVVLAPNENTPDGTEDPGSADDPGVTVGPPGTTFEPDATITFSFVPSQLTGTVVPGAGSGSGNSRSRDDESDRDRNSGKRFPDSAVIVYTNNGSATPVPTDHSDDGTAISGPISGSGSAEADDPTPAESENMAENAAAASGGTCSPEFLQAMAGATQSGRPGSQAAQAALQDCLNTEWLNNLCVNDPVKLRRIYFEQRIALARRFDERAARVIEDLMNQCQARYHFGGEGINPQSTGGITPFSSLDATVCGYIDDEWTANEVYELHAGQGTAHTIDGTGNFSLPAGGGAFYGSVRGENQMAIIGQGVAIPNFEAGFTANFDGNKTIRNLYLVPAGVNVSSAPIELQEKPCVPLAPLPR
ncbi:MAG: hypothetical protein PHP25_02410 [Candidatus Moranbacteria bacterium]|nr:hypothetical protein [Candidatus Moranbacteria bacterium]